MVNTIALAATIGGSVVGLAGVIGNVVNGWIGRKQAIELAENEHEHQRELARGERLYARRASVYEEMLGFNYVVMARVEDAEPLIQLAGQQGAPPEPPSDEEFRTMQVRLRTHCSIEVGNAFDDFAKKAHTFWGHVMVVRTLREQHGQMGNAIVELQAAREEVRNSLRTLERLVSVELAAL
jgi:hypothetical protein